MRAARQNASVVELRPCLPIFLFLFLSLFLSLPLLVLPFPWPQVRVPGLESGSQAPSLGPRPRVRVPDPVTGSLAPSPSPWPLVRVQGPESRSLGVEGERKGKETKISFGANVQITDPETIFTCFFVFFCFFFTFPAPAASWDPFFRIPHDFLHG